MSIRHLYSRRYHTREARKVVLELAECRDVPVFVKFQGVCGNV